MESPSLACLAGFASFLLLVFVLFWAVVFCFEPGLPGGASSAAELCSGFRGLN
jgi:hypothetical protein